MLLIRSANLEDFDKVWPGSVSRLKGWFIFFQKFLEFFPSHVCLNLKAFQLFPGLQVCWFYAEVSSFFPYAGFTGFVLINQSTLGFPVFPC